MKSFSDQHRTTAYEIASNYSCDVLKAPNWEIAAGRSWLKSQYITL